VLFCQVPCLASHASTSGHRKRTYFPSRTTGSGSASRNRARCRVFSRIQLAGTARRSASCSEVRRVASADADEKAGSWPVGIVPCLAFSCLSFIVQPLFVVQVQCNGNSKLRISNPLRVNVGPGDSYSLIFSFLPAPVTWQPRWKTSAKFSRARDVPRHPSAKFAYATPTKHSH
jgi:hypothetical protein